MNDPVIRFEKYQIEKINYHLIDEDDTNEYEMEFSGASAISDDGENGKVTFDLSIPDKTNNRKIDVIINGFFSFRDDVKSEDEKIQYLGVNGAAMLFPYLRTVVSMISVLDKSEAILFPTLNFVELMEQSEKKD